MGSVWTGTGIQVGYVNSMFAVFNGDPKRKIEARSVRPPNPVQEIRLFSPRLPNTSSFLVFCDFSKPGMTASPIFHDHEERKTKYIVSRTPTWGCFILHKLSHLWQGANAGEEEGPEAFAPVRLYWILSWIKSRPYFGGERS